MKSEEERFKKVKRSRVEREVGMFKKIRRPELLRETQRETKRKKAL